MNSKTKLLAALIVASILIVGVATIDQAFADKKPKKPKLRDLVNNLALALDTIEAEITSLADRVTILEQSSSGHSYDDTELRERIAALEAKTKAYTINTGGVTPIVTKSQFGAIHYVSTSHPNCVFNNVVFDGGRSASYGWCPQSNNDAFFIPLENATSTTLVNISIGNAPSGTLVPNCIKYRTGLIEAEDGDGEPFSEIGILAVCDKTLAAGELLTYDWANP